MRSGRGQVLGIDVCRALTHGIEASAIDSGVAPVRRADFIDSTLLEYCASLTHTCHDEKAGKQRSLDTNRS